MVSDKFVFSEKRIVEIGFELPVRGNGQIDKIDKLVTLPTDVLRRYSFYYHLIVFRTVIYR